ncbi:alcohol dehydrogenase GroES domain-containing protein [Xylaria flabelliformis]|nr:alcohol dehydrogenase GroES domain-containing protein [Xylaria flabelliformis]
MSSHVFYNLPPTFKGLQFTSSTDPAKIVELPTPLPTAGSVILRPLYSNIVSYSKDIFCNGNPRGYPYPLPLIPGTNAICRIAAVPQDTPYLKPGMLVYASGVIRHRDNALATPLLQGILMGHTSESEALMKGEWRNGTWAELVKVPAENVHVLDERLLTKELGYKIIDLGYISTLLVAYGGLSDAGLRPGETIVVAPATGNFGSAAVFVALAMGAAKVIAMGRNTEKLQQILEGTSGRVKIAPITGHVEADAAALQAHGHIDIYFDISPKLNSTPSYMRSAISSLRPKGRISFMGGISSDVQIPYSAIVFKGLTLHGTFMYTRQQADELIKLVETGMLPIGSQGGFETPKEFTLEQWREAFEHAYDQIGPRKAAYFIVNKD